MPPERATPSAATSVPPVSTPATPAAATVVPAAGAGAEGTSAAPLSEEKLLLLALPDHLTESAIRIKIRNVGLKEAAKWVGENHRRYCPLCTNHNRLSLMLATHESSAPAPVAAEVEAADLPPLAG
jgi:hypothetical protein